MKNRIREFRRSLGLSQTDFAERLGMTRSIVSNMELGLVEIPDYRIKSMIKEFDVSETWLRTGQGKMFDVEPDPDRGVLDQIQKEYKDNPVLRALLESYVKLSDAQRKAFDDYVTDFVDNYKKAKVELARRETLELSQRRVDVDEDVNQPESI